MITLIFDARKDFIRLYHKDKYSALLVVLKLWFIKHGYINNIKFVMARIYDGGGAIPSILKHTRSVIYGTALR